MQIYFGVLFLLFTLCDGNDSENPLTAVNPFQLIQTKISKSFVPSDELLVLPEKFSLSSFDLRDGYHSNDSCANSIEQFVVDLVHKKPYTKTVLDSWGKPGSGILEGNLNWIGRYYECLGVDANNFKGKYCATFIGRSVSPASLVPTVSPGLNIGGCYPDTCSASNITSLFTPFIKNLAVVVTCPEQPTSWKAKDIVGLAVALLLVLLVIASTLYGYITEQLENRDKYFDKNEFPPNSVSSVSINRGNLYKMMTSFSIIHNTRRLLSTTQRPTDITCLHGMRFLSMSWVMLGHCFLFPIMIADNVTFSARYIIDNWEFQAIANATFSVDSFFFLSGLLAAYLGLRHMNKTDGKINVLMMYLHRYLRLTPPYAFMILMVVSLWPKFGDGPLWPGYTSSLGKGCEKYWYTNLLYFNNLYPANMQEECFAWGWYLANDSQFYLLAPLFLLALYNFPRLGISLTAFVATASIAITGAFSAHTQQQPQIVGIGYLAHQVLVPSNSTVSHNNATSALVAAAPPQQYSLYMSDLYAKPWCRIGAYLVGILTGYILHANNNKVKMSRVVVTVGWMVAAATNCAILYGLFPTISSGDLMSINTAAFYNAVSRPIWCMGLAWVVIACVSGYGGPVNTLLSWRAFIPLSRLTYCAYLIHPLVLWWFTATGETLYHSSIPAFVMIFLATLVLTNLFAYLVAMLVEFPVIELLKLLQNKDERPQVNNIVSEYRSLGNDREAEA